jgi:hypothetical protein
MMPAMNKGYGSSGNAHLNGGRKLHNVQEVQVSDTTGGEQRSGAGKTKEWK